MLKNSIYLFLGIFFIAIQTSVLPFFFGPWLRIDFILIMAVYLGMMEDIVNGSILSFLLGYMMDLTSGGPPGINAFSKLIAFFVPYMTTKKIFAVNDMIFMVIVTLFCILDTFVNILLIWVRLSSLPEANVIIKASLHVTLTGLASFFIFHALKTLDKYRSYKERTT